MLSPNAWCLLAWIFGQFLIASSKKDGSLVFVIDNTGSMYIEIDQVKYGVDKIMDIVLQKESQIKNIVLVTFNDPDRRPYPRVKLVTNTKDRHELKQALRSIRVYGGGDCPEYSLSGIKRALEESYSNSYMFVFTDASAKDIKLINEVKAIALRKGCQITFVITPSPSCFNESFDVYYEIAMATYGHVFLLDNKQEVTDVLDFVSQMTSGENTVLVSKEIPENVWNNVTFNIDSLTEYAIISASGQSVQFGSLRGPSLHHEKGTWIKNTKVIKLIDPSPGTYIVSVKGSSRTNVIVYGRTDFSFEHGFSKYEVTSLADTDKQPTSGSKYHLSIASNDPNHVVNLKVVQILNLNDMVLIELPLRKVSKDFYVTNLFIPPDNTFQIMVAGEGVFSHKSVSRMGKTPITPKLQRFEPTVRIEGPTEYLYKEKTALICKVKAFPVPAVVWKDEKGNILQSQIIETNPPYYREARLSTSFTIPQTYLCAAQNELGQAVAQVDVAMKSPFTVPDPSRPIVVQNVDLDEKPVIYCKITSALPVKISWWRIISGQDKLITKTDPNFSISDDETELKINKMNINLEGQYKCRASLVDDDNIQETYVTEVKIQGLVAPKIAETTRAITTIEKVSVTIICKVLKGKPVPKIVWWYKRRGSDIFDQIIGSQEQLTIDNVSLKDSGEYKCVVTNDIGKDQKLTDLIVEAPPQIMVSSNRDLTNVPYNSRVTITCKVTAYPEPIIVWRDGKGVVKKNIIKAIKTAALQDYISEITIENAKESETFYCDAFNALGRTVSNIDMKVSSPFVINNNNSTHVKKVNYDDSTTLDCKIKSLFPMKIIWSRIIRGTEEEISSTDLNIFISPDGTELKIDKMDLHLEGKYKCKAVLTENEDIQETYTTEIKIDGLMAPKIAAIPKELTAVENESVSIVCKILGGKPQPKLTWYFKRPGSDKIVTLSNSKETLTLYNVGLNNSGEYKCVSDNIAGKDEQSTNLIIKVSPKITLSSNEDIANVPYNSKISITCKVTAYPEPIIVWKDSKKHVLRTEKPSVETTSNYRSYLTINHVKKSEKYYCHAINAVGEKVSYADVRVVNPLVLDNNITTSKFEYHEDTVIYCKIRSSLPMKITWFRIVDDADKVINPTDLDFSISSDGTELKIKKLDLSLQGKYKCRANILENENIQQTYTFDVKIQDLVTPKIAQMPTNITIREGSPAFIECKILNGNPKPSITWLFKQHAIEEIVHLDEAKEQLEISDVSLRDSGRYICVATNVAGQDKQSTELIVEAPPRIINKNEMYSAVEGDIAQKIPCEVYGYPNPVVTWTKNNSPIINNNKYVIIDNNLVINHPKENDSNNYTCEAVNKLGKAQKTFITIVKKTVSDEDRGEVVYVYHDITKNENTKLTCPVKQEGAKGYRKWHHNWYLNGQTLKISNPVLIIKDPEDIDLISTTCRSSSIESTVAKTYVVEVGFPPKFLTPPPTEPVNWNGNEISLDCRANTSSPFEVVEWFYNGELVLPVFNETEKTVLGWGNHTCRISTPFGTIVKTFQVTSSDCLLERVPTIGKMPLILDSNTKKDWVDLYNEANNYIVEKNQKILLSCPSSSRMPNSFYNFDNTNEVLAICDHEDIFLVNNKLYKFRELQCDNPVVPNIVSTGKKCWNNGSETLKVVFDVNQFIEVYEVCFDKLNKLPLYAKMTMTKTYNSDNDIEGAQWYKNSMYMNEEDGKYDCKGDSVCCMSKSQLVNAGDVKFGSAQNATFIDGLNSVAVWRPCTNISTISWKGIEESIRLLPTYYAKEFIVWSGASHYNKRNGISTPRYLWKVVQFSPSETVAIVHVNDPAPLRKDLLCDADAQCENVDWMIFTEFTYCCGIQSFASAYNVPKEIFA